MINVSEFSYKMFFSNLKLPFLIFFFLRAKKKKNLISFKILILPVFKIIARKRFEEIKIHILFFIINRDVKKINIEIEI